MVKLAEFAVDFDDLVEVAYVEIVGFPKLIGLCSRNRTDFAPLAL